MVPDNADEKRFINIFLEVLCFTRSIIMHITDA